MVLGPVKCTRQPQSADPFFRDFFCWPVLPHRLRRPKQHVVSLNVRGFDPENVNVGAKNGQVVVNIRQERNDDVVEMSRRFPIPKGAKADEMHHVMTAKGVLTVRFPRTEGEEETRADQEGVSSVWDEFFALQKEMNRRMAKQWGVSQAAEALQDGFRRRLDKLLHWADMSFGNDGSQNCGQVVGAEKSDASGQYTLELDVRHFKPNEIKVNVRGKRLKLEARHEEDGPRGSEIRHVTRTLELPDSVDTRKVQYTLKKCGSLELTAPALPSPV